MALLLVVLIVSLILLLTTVSRALWQWWRAVTHRDAQHGMNIELEQRVQYDAVAQPANERMMPIGDLTLSKAKDVSLVAFMVITLVLCVFYLAPISGDTPANAIVQRVTLRGMMGGFVGCPVASVNPTICAQVGDTVIIDYINGEDTPHQLLVAGIDNQYTMLLRNSRNHSLPSMPVLHTRGERATIVLPDLAISGVFLYYCGVGGHLEAGMAGKLVVCNTGRCCCSSPLLLPMPPAKADEAINIVRRPDNIPGPIRTRVSLKNDSQPCLYDDWLEEKRRDGQSSQCPYPIPNKQELHTLPNRTFSKRHNITLVVEEVVGWLSPNVTMTYWTYNRTVPGPMLRVRMGDSVFLRFVNKHGHHATMEKRGMAHSVDMHGISGQGGGAGSAYVSGTHTFHGEESFLFFKALIPGAFMYHCVSPFVTTHIQKGMHGILLVEPPQGLPHVDHEFYLVQSEIHTEWPLGSVSHDDGITGHQRVAPAHAISGIPDYFVWNGAFHAFWMPSGGTPIGPVFAGETVRMIVGNAGPDSVSSFHVIGEMFDRVFREGGLSTPPAENIQTTVVLPGGTTVVDMYIDVPGVYYCTDHALTRTFRKGLASSLVALDPSTRHLLPNVEAALARSVTNESYHDVYFGLCDSRHSAPQNTTCNAKDQYARVQLDHEP